MGGLWGVPVGTWVMLSLQQGWLGAAGMDTGPGGPGDGGGHPKLGKAGWGLGRGARGQQGEGLGWPRLRLHGEGSAELLLYGGGGRWRRGVLSQQGLSERP